MRGLRLVLVLVLVAGLFAPIGLAAQDTKRATLAVEQPEYIDGDVNIEKVNGTNKYALGTDRANLHPQNFESESVIDFGVVEGEARLSYSERFDRYEFDARGTEGTYEVYWEVRETRDVENNTTTVRVRYTALVEVSDTTSYEHLPMGTSDQRRSDAQNWTAFESGLEEIWGDDADIEEKAQLALDLSHLRANPLAALSGSYTSTWILLLIGGVGSTLVLLTIAGFHLGIRWHDIKYINRNESLKADEQELSDRLTDLELREKKTALQNMDWWDVFEDDYRSRAARDAFGENLLDGTTNLLSVCLWRNILHDRLQVMAANGYVGVVERDSLATDGGDVEDRQITNASIVRESEVEDGDETVSLDEPSDEFLDAVDSRDTELKSFDLVSADLPEDRHTEYESLTLEELMEEFDVQRRDFESPDVFGHYFREFIESVRQHNFTDENGAVRTTQFTMNTFLQLSQKMIDKEGLPVFEFLGEAVERELIERDPIADAEEFVSDVEKGKHS